MNKRLLTMLLALIMLVSILPVAAFAEGDDSAESVIMQRGSAVGSENSGGVSENAPSKSAESQNTGVKEENNTAEDEDDEADTEGDGIYQEDNDNKENVDEITIEGEEQKADIVTDNAENDGTLQGDAEDDLHYGNTLGYSLARSNSSDTCAHLRTEWYYTDVGRAQVCLDCKQYIVPWEEHSFMNGVCTKCGYKLACTDTNFDCICDTCGDEYHAFKVLKRDEASHWRVCNYCGETVVGKEAHKDENNDGWCDVCSYEIGEDHEYVTCQHQNTEWIQNQFVHYQVCEDCHKTTIEAAAHTMIGGKCTECGYSPCVEGFHSFIGGGFHKTLGATHECEYCGYFDACEDYDNNCICDVCGAVIHVFSLEGINAQYHQEVCQKCGVGLTAAKEHVDSDDNGICDSCYYQIRECTHENADYYFDYTGHTLFCWDCHTVLSENNGEHIMDGGVCTICGYAPCAEHSYDSLMQWDGMHACTVCFMQENCTDLNRDCCCDICGIISHPNSVYVTTNNIHLRYCLVCGQFNGMPSSHYDNDGNGKCDSCGYQMDETIEEGKQEDMPNLPEEPEISADINEDPELIKKSANYNSPALYVNTTKNVLPEYQTLYNNNSEMFGWIKIDGTAIDYPVMHTPGNPGKYQNLSFEKTQSEAGTPYINEKCDFDSDNIIIYANNMDDGSMFHGLLAYEKKDFWQEHPVISFDTIYEKQEFEVFAAYYDEEYAKDRTDFQIDNFVNAKNKAEFDSAISSILEKAIYETNIDISYGDQLITLITDTENGRFVVIARKK